MRFALLRALNSLREALGRKRSCVRTAIVELSWQDLLAVWFAQTFPELIQQKATPIPRIKASIP